MRTVFTRLLQVAAIVCALALGGWYVLQAQEKGEAQMQVLKAASKDALGAPAAIMLGSKYGTLEPVGSSDAEERPLISGTKFVALGWENPNPPLRSVMPSSKLGIFRELKVPSVTSIEAAQRPIIAGTKSFTVANPLATRPRPLISGSKSAPIGLPSTSFLAQLNQMLKDAVNPGPNELPTLPPEQPKAIELRKEPIAPAPTLSPVPTPPTEYRQNPPPSPPLVIKPRPVVPPKP